MPDTTWISGRGFTGWRPVEPSGRWVNETAVFRWNIGTPEFQWSYTLLPEGWDVGYESITMSHLSTEYVNIPVSATKAGSSYNPTGDEVQFAFMPTPTQAPGNSDWVSGSWDASSSNVIYPYTAQCLVGPAGTISLVQGTYVIYIKITDNPEVPVLIAGQLVIN